MVAGLLLLGLRGSGSRPAPVSVYLNDEAHLSFRRRFFLASVESDTNWFFPDFMSSKRCLATTADIVLKLRTSWLEFLSPSTKTLTTSVKSRLQTRLIKFDVFKNKSLVGQIFSRKTKSFSNISKRFKRFNKN